MVKKNVHNNYLINCLSVTEGDLVEGVEAGNLKEEDPDLDAGDRGDGPKKVDDVAAVEAGEGDDLNQKENIKNDVYLLLNVFTCLYQI